MRKPTASPRQYDKEIEEYKAQVETAQEKLETAYAKKFAEDAPLPEPWSVGKEYAPPLSKKEVIAFLREADRREGHKETRTRQQKMNRRHIRRGLLLAGVITVTVSIFATVALAHENIFNFFLELHSQYVAVHNAAGGGQGNVIDVSGHYIPDEASLPEGYECDWSASSLEQNLLRLVYRDSQGRELVFKEHNNYTGTLIDSQEADLIEHVKIDGQEGVLVETKGRFKLSWGTEPRFLIVGSVTKEEILEIAASVHFTE